ncbi:MAG: hypothetical protein AB8F26_01680 [Phycisphaerales bacterium]
MSVRDPESEFNKLVASGKASDPFVVECVTRLIDGPNPRIERAIMIVCGVFVAGLLIWFFILTGALQGTGRTRVVVILLSALITAGVAQAFYRSRFISRFGEQACRECGYDLSDMPSAFDVTARRSPHPVGPIACPECGQRWPLVFPQ